MHWQAPSECTSVKRSVPLFVWFNFPLCSPVKRAFLKLLIFAFT